MLRTLGRDQHVTEVAWAAPSGQGNPSIPEIVRRCDQAKGFVVLPERWIVERTIGWLNRCRRLAIDWENLTHNALAFLRLASIRLMLGKLCNPS